MFACEDQLDSLAETGTAEHRLHPGERLAAEVVDPRLLFSGSAAVRRDTEGGERYVDGREDVGWESGAVGHGKRDGLGAFGGGEVEEVLEEDESLDEDLAPERCIGELRNLCQLPPREKGQKRTNLELQEIGRAHV